MQALRPLQSGLALSLELAMLAAFGVWGFHAGTTAPVRWALGLGLPAVTIAVWGLFLAPRARRRLPPRGVAAVSLVLFELGALALRASGHGTLARVVAIAAVASVGLSLVLK